MLTTSTSTVPSRARRRDRANVMMTPTVPRAKRAVGRLERRLLALQSEAQSEVSRSCSDLFEATL